MRIAKSIVTVRMDRNEPVHISEVIPEVLGPYRHLPRTQPGKNRARRFTMPEQPRLSEKSRGLGTNRAQLLNFPLGKFWVRRVG